MKPITIDRRVRGDVRGIAGRLARLARSLVCAPLLAAPLLALTAACAVEPGYGYGYGGNDSGPAIGIGLDYYGVGGYDYGGWGGNYRSGPPRGGPRSFDGGERGPHAYRAAPSGRGMPSLPGGGGRGGRGGGRR